MKPFNVLLTYISLIFATLLSSASTHAQFLAESDNRLPGSNADEFLAVEQAYKASITTQDNHTIITWQIAPKYYLYKHAFTIEAQGEAVKGIDYSDKGIDRHDEYFGDVTAFYNELSMTIPKAKHISLSSQGCADAGLCYPPRTQYFYQVEETGKWIETDTPLYSSPPPFATQKPTDQKLATDSSPKHYNYIHLIILAFVGGLILNLMPCVLPVLTLKVLSFAKQNNSRQRIIEGWAYTAGVISSFIAVAAVILLLKASGQAIGWGFQLQSPIIVTGLVYLFVIMGLSLLGALQLQGPVISGNANSSSATLNAFFTGVLACIVASPCTAPFMGTAIGASLNLPLAQNISLFASLGLGMASPFLLLSYAPQLAKWLPKPGNWMNTLKEVLAFPLFATAVWLSHIAIQQLGSNNLSILLGGCIFISFIVWWRKSLTLSLVAALLVITTAGSAWLYSKPSDSNPKTAFDLTQLDKLIKSKDAVFVNVTASWCITCKANEKVALKRQSVIDAFTETETVYVEADWTSYNADIAKLLERHNRNGIPLYLYYSQGNIAEPYILPQILSEKIIIKTLKNRRKS